MSLQLKLLGGLSLLDPASGRGRVTRRHRLAVLAVLATSGQPVPRERLLSLLWPDSAEETARHALGQVLYGLRQDLALNDLVTGATDLSLDRSLLDCDLWTFRQALADGDRALAVASYAGPFLDDVRLAGADQFERWCESERVAIARDANEAIEWLATDATARGAQADAVQWWKRLATTDRLSSRFAIEYMQALVRAGDRTAALQHARVHTALVRAELELDADPRVAAYVDELQSIPTSITLAATSVEPARAAVVAAPGTVIRPDDAATGDVPDSHVVPTSSRQPVRHRRVALAALVALVAGVGAYAVRSRQHEVAAQETSGIPVAAVLPFDVRGDTVRRFLSEAMSALLTDRLDAPGVLRTLESNAVLAAFDSTRRVQQGAAVRAVGALGATDLVTGTIVVVHDHLEISAEMRPLAAAGPRAVRATVAGSVDSLFALADRLGAALLLAREGRRLGSPALGGTTSVPALKALLAGDGALRSWRLLDAIAAYRNAIAIDSTYALAWYRLGIAEGWGRVGDGGREARANAVRLATQLPDRYARLIRAVQHREDGDAALAGREFAALVQAYPDDAEAWAEFGEYRTHQGPRFGDPASDAEGALLRALSLDSIGHPEVRGHLAQIAYQRGNAAMGDTYLSFFLRSGVDDDPSSQNARLTVALTGNSSASVPQVIAKLRAVPPALAARSLRQAIAVVGVSPASRAVAESLAVTPASLAHQREGLGVLMELDAVLHDAARALRDASMLAAVDSVAAAREWGFLVAGPDVHIPVALARSAGALLERMSIAEQGRLAAEDRRDAAMLALRAGDAADFERRIAPFEVRDDPDVDRRRTRHALRATHAQLAGDSVAFMREAAQLTAPLDWQWSRWLRGVADERAGRTADAARWYLAALWGPLATVLEAPVLDRVSAIEARSGVTSTSIRRARSAPKVSVPSAPSGH